MIRKLKNQKKILTVVVAMLLSSIIYAQDLIPATTATHRAIRDGNWTDSSIWSSNTVPGEGAIVNIPAPRTVTYNANSNAHIFAIRNAGTFRIRAANRNQTRRLVVDTFINTMTSFLDISANSAASSGRINIIIKPYDLTLSRRPNNWNNVARQRYTDLDNVRGHNERGVVSDGSGVLGRYNWDPTQASLGLMSMGRVVISGINKTDFAECATNVDSGARTVTLQSNVNGWNVGDDIVISATQRPGLDQEYTVESVTGGNRIRLNRRSTTSHIGVNGNFAYMANLTRNITIRSDHTNDRFNVTRRGHVMFMNNGNVLVENTAFVDLGRTNKSNLLDDLRYTFTLGGNNAGTNPFINFRNLDGTAAAPRNIENQRGRYAFHFHRTLARNSMNRGMTAIARGNAVVGSPGWGMVHHDSNADFISNVVYDIRGGGMIAESGSEIGEWRNNLVLGVVPNNNTTTFLSPAPTFFPSNVRRTARRTLDDDFRAGTAYGLQGRAVRMVSNVAASSTRAFHYQGTGEGLVGIADELNTSIYEDENVVNPFPLNSTITRSSPALFEFRDNISASCNVGFKSQGREDFAFHQVLSVVENFTAWNIQTFAIYISSNFGYLLKDSSLHARRTSNTSVGLLAQTDDDNINIVNSTFTNFNDRTVAVAGGAGGTGTARTLNHRSAQYVFHRVTWNNTGGVAPYAAMISERNSPISIRENTGARAIIAPTRADLENPNLVNIRFTPRAAGMDAVLNFSRTNPDFRIRIDGNITDRAGTRRFANYTPRDNPFIGRTYNFRNGSEARANLTNVRRQNGVFFGTFTEHVSDRTTGRITAIPIRIRMNNFRPANSSIIENVNLNFEDEDNGLEIFPNPVTGDVLHVKQNKNSQLSIYNVYGSKIKEVKAKEGNIDINVSDLPAGLYILKSGEEIKKFMIQ